MPEIEPRFGSIFSDLPSDLSDERFDPILVAPGIRLERILSHGQVTPPGEWYDQEQDEWVLLLRGAARLRIEGRPELLALTAGDYLLLPAHCRHRVEWTSPEETTVWLAVHYSAGGGQRATAAGSALV